MKAARFDNLKVASASNPRYAYSLSCGNLWGKD
jgi:hypothetical protein